MAKRYRAGELYNGGGNPAVYLASDYDALAADRDQISLTLDVAKADRDKWFNRAKALEAALRTICPQCDMPLADRTALETPVELDVPCPKCGASGGVGHCVCPKETKGDET